MKRSVEIDGSIVPNELVHSPANAGGPEVGKVSHPAMAATSRLRKEFGVGVVASCLPCCFTINEIVKLGALATRSDGFPTVRSLDGYEPSFLAAC